MTVLTIALLVVIMALVAVIGWLLRPAPSARRGGTLDLVPAAARGELDLDWSDPRPQPIALTSEGEIRFDTATQAGGWLVLDSGQSVARRTAAASG